MSGEAGEVTTATSTSEIASQVIESAEAPATETATPETPAVAEPAVPDLSPAAKFLVEQGHKHGKRPDNKTDLAWLPFSTVEKMLDRYLGTHKSTWDGEKGTLEGQAKELREALEEQRRLIGGDPLDYMREVAKFDARYGDLIAKLTAAPAPAAAPVFNEPMPEPDLDLGDGRRTYSLAGLEKRDAWLQKKFESTLLGKVDERMKPFADREKAEQERAAQAKVETAQRERVNTQLTDLQKMPLFGAFPADGSLTPFQAEVLKVLQADTAAAKAAGQRPTMTPKEAYYEVASKQWQDSTDPAKVRERVIEELNTAAKASPTVSRAGAETAKAPKPDDTRTIAERTIARMEREAASRT